MIINMNLNLKIEKLNLKQIKLKKQLKELQKLKDYETIKKIINKHINENWNIFLKELQNLRIQNNVKEYFLRLRFYTFINKNTDILKNKKINDKIVTDKKLINIEINKKYKTLLGDEGHKEYYFNKNDNVIDINAADVHML